MPPGLAPGGGFVFAAEQTIQADVPPENVVAMNSGHAASLGIDFRAGTPAQVETASGVVEAWVVALQSVDVGGIRVDNVRATVVEGTHPTTILLGMTYLQHVQMNEKNGILLLSRDY